mgnify:CR=1 FL=1
MPNLMAETFVIRVRILGQSDWRDVRTCAYESTARREMRQMRELSQTLGIKAEYRLERRTFNQR